MINGVDGTLYEHELSPDVPKARYVIEQLNINGIVIWQSETGKIFQKAPNMKPLKTGTSLAEYINN